jgi:hypothetical protein
MLDCPPDMTNQHVVVDGSNIATEGRSLPSLRQLDEAVRAFLAERPHEICTVVVDATFEHRIDASEKLMYDEALAANELLTPPAGSIGRGDRFILEIANRSGATVFSNDSFQEFHGDYDWLFDEGRLVGGKPVPGVGWVFVERTPVRGPKSRMAVRAAGRKRVGRGRARDELTPTSSGVELGPPPVPTAPPPRSRKKAAAAVEPAPPAREKRDQDRRTRRVAPPEEPSNPALPFLEFVSAYQPGATVEAEVVEFSSHGAYVMVGDVRCYAPLKLLADPAPRAARDVLTRGETRAFEVIAIHASRRGIDVGLPGVGTPQLIDMSEDDELEAPTPAAPTRTRGGRRRSGTAKTATDAAYAAEVTDQAPGAPGAEQPESEATLAPAKKAPAKKTAAKKATGKKAPAKKVAAKKVAAKKAPTKKVAAKKAPAKKAPAKKAAAKKAPAKKTPAKKTTAKKAPAKKAPAKKATAKKTTAKKAPAKKATAKKATGR